MYILLSPAAEAQQQNSSLFHSRTPPSLTIWPSTGELYSWSNYNFLNLNREWSTKWMKDRSTCRRQLVKEILRDLPERPWSIFIKYYFPKSNKWSLIKVRKKHLFLKLTLQGSAHCGIWAESESVIKIREFRGLEPDETQSHHPQRFIGKKKSRNIALVFQWLGIIFRI